MNIVKEDLGDQTLLIKVGVAEADYKEAVDKTLKNYRKKANIPGFRPGMAPASVINKMYRRGTVAEEAYRVASEAMIKFLEDNKIEIVGEPMPAENHPELHFDTATDFEFLFNVGVKPEVNIDLAKVKVTRYDIQVEPDMHASYKENFLRRFGKLVDADTIESEDAVSATLVGGDITAEDAYIGLTGMDEEARKPFLGKKVGDKISVNIETLYPQKSQRAAILSVKENELDGIAPEFEATVTRIRRFAAPELNEELYKEAFPDGSVTDEAGLDAFVDAEIKKELVRESDHKLAVDTRAAVVKAADLKLPEAFLKRWLVAINEGKFSMEDIEKEFDTFKEMMSWDILQRHYLKEAGVTIGEEDLKAEARKLAAMQFAYYGMANPEDSMLDNYVGHIMGNKEEARKLYERVTEAKAVEYLDTKVKITNKKISTKDFVALVNA